MSERACRKCLVSKPLKSFPKGSACKEGRRSTCHACHDSAPSKAGPPRPPQFTLVVDAERPKIITAAQNNTLVSDGFWRALGHARKKYGAQLIVVPFRYKNPSGIAPGTDLRGRCAELSARGQQCALLPEHKGACTPNELWWDPKLTPYLLSERTQLLPNLVLAADVKIQPTATDPLSGFDALTGADSCIIGHPKLALRVVPTADHPKILTTTGVCTEKNYSNTKAGALGEFHYSLGATLVEPDGDVFHLRQLLGTEEGAFDDLTLRFTPRGVERAPPPEALLTGDTHVRITDKTVDNAHFGPRGMFRLLKPKKWIANDLNDGETHNPHEKGDLFIASAKQKAGRTGVEAELEDDARFLEERSQFVEEVIVVHSNHDDFLRRWVVDTLNRGCHDAKNLGIFLKLAAYMHESAEMTPGGATYGQPFAWWMRQRLNSAVRFLEPDESCRVREIECGQHGHAGPNGSRGSMKNLARVGVKIFDGHGHTPGIFEGHWRVGTNTPKRQAYHRGFGNNLQADGLIYENGKRALLNIIKGRWCAPTWFEGSR